MASWVYGAAINLVGSVMINLGTNLMKLGHNTRLQLPVHERPAVRRFRSWQLGVALFGLGNIANFVSFGFAAQSLLAALGSIQFVSNVLFGWLVLHEQVTRQILMATALIIGGCVTLMVYGNHESPMLSVAQLLSLYHRPAYVTYLTLLGACALSAFLIYQYGRTQAERQGLAFSQVTGRWGRLLPLSYAAYSGMLGTQSVLFGKSLSLIIRAAVNGSGHLLHWFTYLVLVLFVSAATFWVTRLNKALRLFPGLVIVPTMQISWTLFSILSGMVYFEEYRAMSPLGAVMCSLGVAVIFGGVLLLTRVRKPKKKAMFEMEAHLAEESASLLGLGADASSDALKAQRAARVVRGSMLTRLRAMLASATVSCGQHATLTPLAAYRSETEKGGDDAGEAELLTLRVSTSANNLSEGGAACDAPISPPVEDGLRRTV